MATKKVIVEVHTNAGTVHLLGDATRMGDLDYVVVAIDHRRDGIGGIYKPGIDESHYVVEYRSTQGGRDPYYLVLPTHTVTSVGYKVVEIVEEAPPQPRRAE